MGQQHPHTPVSSTPVSHPVAEPRGTRSRSLLRAMRPRQALTKNLLVLTAPALGGHLLTDRPVQLGALVALVAFTALSAATYLANDIHDVELDRCHPTKCHRPFACGDLTLRTGATAAAALAVLALGLALWWAPDLAAVLVTYLAVQVAYCGQLKHVPGLDVSCVASGFVLRVVAGGVGAGVELSVPFLVVVGAAALFMVAGKRYSEMHTLGARAGTRRSLARYSLRWLRVVWVVSAAVAAAGYLVAATGMAPWGSASAALSLASVPLFAAGVLRYAQHVRRGAAGSPESVVFGDHVLQALGVLWLLPLSTSVLLA